MASEITRILLVVTLIGVALVAGIAVVQTPPESPADSGDSVPTVTDQSGTDDTSVCVVFFYHPSCPHCEDVEEYLDRVRPEHNVTVHQHNTGNDDSVRLLKQYYEAYDVPERDRGGVPIVFVADDYAVGSAGGIDLIQSAIESNETVACPTVSQSAG
ncbi:hypothetical protein [Halapricum desulfuricans]|uniref:Thiol-disulfide isomerase or thioredoxin n=1 Tax=Halapricum desulfuricans TaxID=2841257 RepID=A0A897MVN4_9EURY|nr:hypothetical protein [Halapricum desulfuricans]QSG04547.1 Thiol-disulfide isomerase or thioredoxin [Halapricum desulfuricans]